MRGAVPPNLHDEVLSEVQGTSSWPSTKCSTRTTSPVWMYIRCSNV